MIIFCLYKRLDKNYSIAYSIATSKMDWNGRIAMTNTHIPRFRL